jgi:hypothetical protein
MRHAPPCPRREIRETERDVYAAHLTPAPYAIGPTLLTGR